MPSVVAARTVQCIDSTNQVRHDSRRTSIAAHDIPQDALQKVDISYKAGLRLLAVRSAMMISCVGVLCQDVLPALLHALAPQIRPLAERLLQPDERAALADVTDSMLAYGLQYDAPSALAPVFGQQAPAPVTNLPLKPAIDRLCAYQVSR